MNTGIICACLPTLPLLFKHFKSGTKNTKRLGPYSDQDYRQPLRSDDHVHASSWYATSAPPGARPSEGRQGLVRYTDIESGYKNNSYQMEDVGSVRVQTEVQVDWSAVPSNP
jgi:hypothetical protein